MSDFLTHLAARAIAPPTLRPRVRSRFEPEVEEVQPIAAQRSVTVPSVPAVIAPPAPPVIPSGSDGPGRAGRAAVDAIATPAHPDPPSTPLAMTERSVETVVDVRREVEHDVQRVVETQERVVAVPRIEREQVIRPHRFEVETPRVIRERTITIDRPPRTVAREPQAIEPKQEPVVHVSIGRVEVRAIAQAHEPRAATRTPKMTIDDYVARRKAKERR